MAMGEDAKIDDSCVRCTLGHIHCKPVVVTDLDPSSIHRYTQLRKEKKTYTLGTLV